MRYNTFMNNKILSCFSLIFVVFLALGYFLFKVGLNIGESNYKVSFGGIYYYESKPDILWLSPLKGISNRPDEYLKLEDANFWSFKTFKVNDTVTKTNTTVIDSAKTNDHVYFKNKIVADFDASTYEYFNPTYSKDSKGVYLYSSELINIADTNSFEAIDFNTAKDDNNVYFQGEVVIGADAKSFRAMDGCSEMYRDKNRPYFRKFAITIVEDVDTFNCVTEGYSLYFTDSNNVYRQEESVFFEVISDADRSTFKQVDGCGDTYVDSKSVYISIDKFTGTVEQPLDFTCINGSTTDFTDGVNNYIYNESNRTLEKSII